MIRYLRGLAALLVIVAFTVGAPWLLALWGQPLHLSRWWLQGRDDGTLILVLLTILGWLMWAWFTVSLVLEFGARIVGRHWRLPAFGWSRSLVSGLVVAVLGLLTQPIAQAHEPTPVQPVVRAVDVTEDDGAAADSPQHDPATPEQELQDPSLVHVVETGDDLWSLAERYYGDGMAWRRIARANPSLLTGGPDDLRVGWRLVIPGVDLEPSGRTVTVQRGDTLSSLAEQWLGSSTRWPELLEANRSVISDPDVLAIGAVLVIPVPRPDREETDRPSDDTGRRSDRADTRSERTDQRVPRSERSEPSAPGRADTPREGGEEAPDTPDTTGTEQAEVGPVTAVLPALGALLAAGLVTAVAMRRRVQLALRAPGRRLQPTDPTVRRVENALGQHQDENVLRRLDAAQRLIGRHCAEQEVPVPQLREVVAAPERLTFHFRQAPTYPAPTGFTRTGDAWVLATDLATPDDQDPVAWPALACVGRRDLDHVLVDLAGAGLLQLTSTQAPLIRGARAALLMELTCAWWSSEAEIVLVGAADPFVQATAAARVGWIADAERGVRLLERIADAGASGARVVIIDAELDPAQQRRLAALDPGSAGIGVILTHPFDGAVDTRWSLDERPWPVGPAATLTRRLPVEEFSPQLVDDSLCAAIVTLFEATGEIETQPAPWWSEDETTARRALGAPRRADAAPRGARRAEVQLSGPEVLLLGPVRLVGVHGQPPGRAERQCAEYCAWLLENPGLPGRAMADALLVAEGTRRSNVSRLRTWLGEDAAGQPYLPDAYAGGLRLHPDVTSDWRRFQDLIAPGANVAGDSALVAALELVRGAPLADAAPGQWHWAEGLRVDIISAVRDVALTLAERALASGATDQVRWATARGLAVAPGDERLLACRIRVEHQVGNTREVRRVARRMVDRARELDVPLTSQSVMLLQEVLEGRERAQRVPQRMIS